MRKLAVVLFVAVLVVLAAVAFAGTFLPAGLYGVTMSTDPPTYHFFAADDGPPRTITEGSIVYTYDPETGTYKAPSPSSDSWSFSGTSNDATFYDAPEFPFYGPPAANPGMYWNDR
jgi:ABC-type oligopeptide transport system substrate-binding subunit